MLETLKKIVAWLMEHWTKVPDSEKDRIIRFVVESFDAIFRAFFKSSQSEKAA
ncbi:hypothetical protein [Massilia sp.]|uniref:hypothetical protein n=1 Tax=Massilia sp. TaxID=1882437 RepID=UPI00289C9618|nr:hypothetical protein [Massilia sp.]